MLCYFLLPSQKATLLLIPYHFTIPPTSKNSIFLLFNKILFFNLSLLYLFHHHFFSDSNGNIFLGFLTFVFFFSRLASNGFELCFFFSSIAFSNSHNFSWAMQHQFFSNVDVDSNGLSLAFIIYFQQSFGLYHLFPTIFCFFKFNNYSKQPANFFFFFKEPAKFF